MVASTNPLEMPGQRGIVPPAPIPTAVAAPPMPATVGAIPEPRALPGVQAAPKKRMTLKEFLRKFRPLITGVITFVLLFLVFKSPILISQLSYLTDKPKTAPTETNGANAAVPANPVISIPKINVNAPIVFAKDNAEAAIQKDLEGGVVHYAHTALPGERGNAVIFGHSSNDWWEPGNYKFVFVLLDKLQVGDTYTVNYNSRQYVYRVTESKVVEPTDLSVLRQGKDNELTLITCTPPGTSWKRLVVRSVQISPSPDGSAVASGDADDPGGATLPGNSPSWSKQISDWWKGVTNSFGGN